LRKIRDAVSISLPSLGKNNDGKSSNTLTETPGIAAISSKLREALEMPSGCSAIKLQKNYRRSISGLLTYLRASTFS
jgi:hypothetical protein